MKYILIIALLCVSGCEAKFENRPTVIDKMLTVDSLALENIKMLTKYVIELQSFHADDRHVAAIKVTGMGLRMIGKRVDTADAIRVDMATAKGLTIPQGPEVYVIHAYLQAGSDEATIVIEDTLGNTIAVGQTGSRFYLDAPAKEDANMEQSKSITYKYNWNTYTYKSKCPGCGDIGVHIKKGGPPTTITPCDQCAAMGVEAVPYNPPDEDRVVCKNCGGNTWQLTTCKTCGKVQ